MHRSYTLLVFDWDGTLMDSEARIVACMEAAFADLGLASAGREAYRDIIGLGLREALERLRPGADETLQQQLVTHYRHHFLGANQTPSRLFDGAREVLESLRDAGYRLAIATGKGRVGLDRVLAETGLEPLFEATRCADETRSKPHPRMLFELMDTLGTAPEDTLMVGDTEYDMQMAAQAGAGALAVSYGVHAAERLLRHRPLGCLDDIAELPAWLARRPGRALADAG